MKNLIEIIKIVDTGFMLFFGIFVLWYLKQALKMMPDLIKAWVNFNLAIDNNSKVVSSLKVLVLKLSDKSEGVNEKITNIERKVETNTQDLSKIREVIERRSYEN